MTMTDLLLLPMAKVPTYDPTNIGDVLNPLIYLPKPMGKIPPYIPVEVAPSGPTLDDSLTTQNDQGSQGFGYTLSGPTYEDAVGQSFNSRGGKLVKSRFSLCKVGTVASGTLVSKLYNITGAYGTVSHPTGAALAVSDPLDITTINNPQNHTLATFYDFNFTGANQYVMSAGHYCITVEIATGTYLQPNWIPVGSNYDFNEPPPYGDAHPGNHFVRRFSDQAWLTDDANDTCFEVYIQ